MLVLVMVMVMVPQFLDYTVQVRGREQRGRERAPERRVREQRRGGDIN
jgi:hypothetical protein